MTKEDTRRMRFLVRCWEELERRRRERPLTPVEEETHHRLGALLPGMRLLRIVAALPAAD